MAFDYHRWLSTFPGTNFHELNIDWLVEAVKSLAKEYEQFTVLNTISYQGVWSIDKNYPKWSIVTDSDGNGYISIEPVPAGIEIDNTSYWMKLYDFVTALGALEGRVSTLEGAVSSLTGRVSAVEGSITTLQNAINSLNTYKANRTRSSFTDRNILFVGDSYTNGGNVTKKWYETMCETINPGHYYVSTEGGEGFNSSAGKHYLDRINDFINTHTEAVRNSITDLFITGGYNDLYAGVYNIQDDPSNPYNMEKCVQLCRQYMPNATIYIAMFARTPLVPGQTGHNLIFIERTATAYREGARYLGCKYVDRSEVMLHDYRLFDSDNVHPSQEGHNYLGHYMAQWFMNGSWSFNSNINNNVRSLSITNPDSVVEGHKTVMNPAIGTYAYEQLTDEGVFVRIHNIGSSITAGGSASFNCAPSTGTAANTFNLGHINDTGNRAYFSLLGSNDTFKTPVNCVIRDASDNYHNVPGIITISSNNEILLNFLQMDGNNFQNYNGLHNVIISGIEFTLPLHSC